MSKDEYEKVLRVYHNALVEMVRNLPPTSRAVKIAVNALNAAKSLRIYFERPKP